AGGLYGLELPDSDLQVIRAALVEKAIKESRIVAGDVVTDNGYHGEVVITQISKSGIFQGYYVVDGVTVKGLDISKFVKIADKSGEWKPCRGGVYFQREGGDPKD
ncbi:MAG: hypothetical protein NC548_26630, partial [Lachnospiraceae bacterium]|nr:hypothetical protein [Lachnospiraceae bacterium]